MTTAMQDYAIKIWILGLFHSGTTIFWRAWRKDSRFLCFDEPFNGDTGVWFPGNNEKKTLDEYEVLFRDMPKRFWNLYAPMDPYQELNANLSLQQEHYIWMLINKAQKVVIDETRLHHHLPTIKKLTPDGYVIHLYRRARGFVTSHLLPSKSQQHFILYKIKHRAGHMYRKHIFWNRMELPFGMDRNKVIGGNPRSKFGLLLSEAGYDAERIMCASALVRFLAYWHYSYHLLEREGPKQFGSRFFSVSYESFATNPEAVMSKLYEKIGLECPEKEKNIYSDVHLPKQPFRQDDMRWRDAALIAGFSEEELDTLL